MANDGRLFGPRDLTEAARVGFTNGAMYACSLNHPDVRSSLLTSEQFAQRVTDEAQRRYPDPVRPRVLRMRIAPNAILTRWRYVPDGDGLALECAVPDSAWTRVTYETAIALDKWSADALMELSQLRRNPNEPDV